MSTFDRRVAMRLPSLPSCCCAILLFAAVLFGGAADEDVAVATIPAFNAAFGATPGLAVRPVHTKGFVAEGVFTPSPDAAWLSTAQHLNGGPVAVTVRLSTFAGLPSSPDGGPFAEPLGMSIKFHLGADADTDVVAHSYNGFPAATPREFLDFLRAMAEGGAALARFTAAHPAARVFLDVPKPPPASWANETFFGVNSFVFVDAAGGRRFGRYRIVPSAGESRLTAPQAALASRNYLANAMSAALAQGPVSWHILVQLAEPGDTVVDGSVPWPQDRKLVDLGLLRLDRPVADNASAEQALAFNPLNLVRGIEPSADPMLPARSRAYGESYRLRAQ